MGKLVLKNINNDMVEIEVIRYFENNENEYLIYSLNEFVGDGYIKLYASKIIGNSAHIIVDEDEWFLIKEIVKDIIKSNHEGTILNVIDLDETELLNVVLNDTRIFKLQGNLVNLLSENKNIIKQNVDDPIIEDFEEEVEETELTSEELMTQNEELLVKIEKLENEISLYKEKIKHILNVIEE